MAVHKVTIVLDADSGEVVDAFNDVEKSGKKTSSTLTTLFKGVSVAALALASGVTAAAIEYAEFGSAVAEVNTLLDDSWDTGALDNMTDSVRELAQEFGGDATEQARALYQTISSGAGDADEATKILTASNKLALGGVTDITTATDGLTTVINAYGESAGTAEEISDTFFTAMAFGKTTVGELSNSIGKVAPLAAELGVSFDETAIAAATLTKGGISTSEAMTGLTGIMKAVLKPTKEAKDAAAELGLSFNAQALEAKGLKGFLDDVTKATGGSTEIMAELFGDIEGLNAALALTGKASDDFAVGLEKVANKGGATDKAVEDITTGTGALTHQWNLFTAELRESVLVIGEELEPAFTDLLKTVNEFDLSQATKNASINIQAAKEIIVSGLELIEVAFEKTWNDAVYTTQRAWLSITKIASAGIRDVSDELKALDAQYDASTTSLNNQSQALRENIAYWADAHNQIQRASNTVEISEIKTRAFQDSVTQLGVSASGTGGVIEDELISPVKTLAETTGEAGNELQSLIDRLDPVGRLTRDYGADQEYLNAALAAGAIELPRYLELMEELDEQYAESTQATDTFTEAIGTMREEAAGVFKDMATKSVTFKEAMISALTSIVHKGINVLVDALFGLNDFSFGDILTGGGIGGVFNSIASSLGSVLGIGKATTTVLSTLGATAGTTGAALGAGGLSAGAYAAGSALGTFTTASTAATAGLGAGGLSAGAATAGVELGVLGAETVAATASTTGMTASLAAAGPYALAAAAGVALLTGALSGGRSAAEIMRDEVRELTAAITAGTAETFKLAGGFTAAGAAGSHMITGEHLGRLQQFLDKIPGINTRLQEVDGTPVLRVLDEMDRGVVELDNLIKGATGSMTESFAEFSANAQDGANEVAATYTGAADQMRNSSTRAASEIGTSFTRAGSVIEGASNRAGNVIEVDFRNAAGVLRSESTSAAGTLSSEMQSASSSAASNVRNLASSAVGELNNIRSAANSAASAVSQIGQGRGNNNSNIDSYAAGGIARGPLSGHLEMLHGDELVLPPAVTRFVEKHGLFNPSNQPGPNRRDAAIKNADIQPDIIELTKETRDGRDEANAINIQILNTLKRMELAVENG